MTLDRLQWPWPLYFKRVFLLTGLSINTPVISPARWSVTARASSALLIRMILQVSWTANWLYQHRLDSQTLKRDISPIIVARLCEGNDTDHHDVPMIGVVPLAQSRDNNRRDISLQSLRVQSVLV